VKSSISRKELIKKFRKLGFEGPFSGGKHQFMKRGERKIRIPNPHSSGEIHIGLLKEILSQAGIEPTEFENA